MATSYIIGISNAILELETQWRDEDAKVQQAKVAIAEVEVTIDTGDADENFARQCKLVKERDALGAMNLSHPRELHGMLRDLQIALSL